jgi:UDP-N-acetyl-D-mannosaminuronic acid transferase (WecB/TagA/CpsF family)
MVRQTTVALPVLIVFLAATVSAARAETIDQLYEKAKAEKALVFYTGVGPGAAKATADAFEKRFPGIAVTAKGGFSAHRLKDGVSPGSEGLSAVAFAFRLP